MWTKIDYISSNISDNYTHYRKFHQKCKNQTLGKMSIPRSLIIIKWPSQISYMTGVGSISSNSKKSYDPRTSVVSTFTNNGSPSGYVGGINHCTIAISVTSNVFWHKTRKNLTSLPYSDRPSTCGWSEQMNECVSGVCVGEWVNVGWVRVSRWV